MFLYARKATENLFMLHEDKNSVILSLEILPISYFLLILYATEIRYFFVVCFVCLLQIYEKNIRISVFTQNIIERMMVQTKKYSAIHLYNIGTFWGALSIILL